MRLRIVTPLSVVLDADGVLSVRAEDASGSFGILPGHADFLTSLSVGVLAWTGADGARHFCALRRGILSVSGGREVEVATREAVAGDDPATLADTVLAGFRAAVEAERAERAGSLALQLSAIRRMVGRLRPASQHGGEGAR